MNEKTLITHIAEEVEKKLSGESSGHDWWHVYRVWKMAEHIGREENANMLVVELAALLHDIADWKFHGGDEAVGPRIAEEMLARYNAPQEVIEQTKQAIMECGFKGAHKKPSTFEGQCVQDADRLDAIGAIGIGRVFAYGGHAGRLMWDPNSKPTTYASKEEYLKNKSSTVNHFYEKLLLLKEYMNTQAGKIIAEGRHRFMEEYLDRFYKEWEGNA
jgi:uncharacterized protein